MGLIELRPDGVHSSSGSPAIVGGSASHNAAQADSSDATYTELDGGGEGVYLSFGTFSFPALSQIRHLYARVRIQSNSNDLIYNEMDYRLFQFLDGTTYNLPGEFPVPSTVWTDFYGTTHTTNPRTGLTWTQADIDGLGIAETRYNSASRPYRFAAAYIYVSYNEAPTVTVTAPASPVTNTSRPTITWTYSDPDNDTQDRYQVKIFSAAQYGAGGFSPDTSTATYDSGVIVSTATTQAINVDLVNGVTYRAYVRAADTGSDVRYGNWAYQEFTMNISPPATPTLTVTHENTTTQSRVKLEIQGNDGTQPPVQRHHVEYSDDSGATWRAARDGTNIVPNGSQYAVIYDYERPVGTRQYRAKTTKDV